MLLSGRRRACGRCPRPSVRLAASRCRSTLRSPREISWRPTTDRAIARSAQRSAVSAAVSGQRSGKRQRNQRDARAVEPVPARPDADQGRRSSRRCRSCRCVGEGRAGRDSSRRHLHTCRPPGRRRGTSARARVSTRVGDANRTISKHALHITHSRTLISMHPSLSAAKAARSRAQQCTRDGVPRGAPHRHIDKPPSTYTSFQLKR